MTNRTPDQKSDRNFNAIIALTISVMTFVGTSIGVYVRLQTRIGLLEYEVAQSQALQKETLQSLDQLKVQFYQLRK